MQGRDHHPLIDGMREPAARGMPCRSDDAAPQGQIATRPCEIDGYAHQHFAYQPRILGPGSSQRPGAPEVLPLRASHEKMDPGADNPLGEGKTLKSPPIAHFSKFPSPFSSCVCKSLESQDEIRSSDLPPPPASEELLPLSDTALLIRAPEGLEPY